jgi:hypothetical protein
LRGAGARSGVCNRGTDSAARIERSRAAGAASAYASSASLLKSSAATTTAYDDRHGGRRRARAGWPHAGLRIFGSLGNARLSLELSTEATLPTERSASDQTGFSARSLDAKLAPCAHAAAVGFCGLGMIGLLSVRGQGVDRIESPSSLVAGAGLRLQLLWPEQSSVAALLHAEAVILLTPRTIVLNREAVWSTAPVVFSAGLDLAAIFR